MRIKINQISVPLAFTPEMLAQKAAAKVGCPTRVLRDIVVRRRSLDARERNPEPVYIIAVEAELAMDRLPRKARVQDIVMINGENTQEASIPRFSVSDENRPLVVGAGPAGLLAALELALSGARPILIERGDDATTRASKVSSFWSEGVLDPDSNVLYGEGGAGLFSDGKLTARSKDRERLRRFFQHLVDCGADPDILIDAEPHIGSDVLLNIVPEIRRRIMTLGGDVRFRSHLTDIHVQDGRLRGVTINGDYQSCSACILAVGHSARDVYEMLERRRIALQAKSFAIGVRLEIPQEEINKSQYGRFAGNPQLGAASFRLTRRAEGRIRSCYSFCMCPGGTVMSCASEPERLTTNGMSFSQRALNHGNAAFLVPVDTADFGYSALAGVKFQRDIESKAFTLAGGGYQVPAVRLVDFLSERVSDLPDSRSCRTAVPAELRDILPEYVTRTLARTIPTMLKPLRGVIIDDALLYGPETRSSAPLRITRSDMGVSTSVSGLYPAGEGAGYAGGIVSSAIDGMKQAEHCLEAIR